jgi:hypothetical protein
MNTLIVCVEREREREYRVLRALNLSMPLVSQESVDEGGAISIVDIS